MHKKRPAGCHVRSVSRSSFEPSGSQFTYSNMESGEKHELKGVGDVKVHVQTDDNHPDIQLGRVTQIGNIRVLGLEPADADFYSSFPVDRRAKLLRKVP